MNEIGAGDLTEQITFQTRAAGVDDLGDETGDWANVPTDPTVWAKPAFITGRDIEAAGQLNATLDAKFIVRYRTDVLPTWRILWNGASFAIVGFPAPIGREWLEIACTKGTRSGT